jgi:hypothetical protein
MPRADNVRPYRCRRRAQLRHTDRAWCGLTDVVAELSCDTPIALGNLIALEQSCAPCFGTYRVQLVGLFIARDRRRAVLLFRAPDAESVRLACRHVTLPFERVWQCQTPIIKSSRRVGMQHENE